jgi:uncharacterized membrane protein YozB (DUF420 family)
MISITDLPLVNAVLNSTSAILLVIGHRFMKQGRIDSHKKCMILVFIFSGLFLTSYLVYHYSHGSQPFQGEGWTRPLYFAILSTHTVLATAIVPLSIITLIRGLKGRFELHKKIARFTYPIWLYVSITGVVIYLMLYRIFG